VSNKCRFPPRLPRVPWSLPKTSIAMETENDTPSNIPDVCTHEHCLWHVESRHSLPPAAVLRTASATEVGKIVGCSVLAPFLKDFFPAVFGKHQPCLPRRAKGTARLA